MKNLISRTAILLLTAILLSSCSVITGIFKAGMGVGIAIVVIIVLIVVFIIAKIAGKK